ncbi:accessory factor UbiK family protein [Neptuniibacter sp.]|jgi:BMFP domain-containing protein YqiC|uniref:accessory factor UbiK family protein n=1 Tax=Neptuniibacter sp. TaxID=1962643 RepID=UPI0026247DFF|nr:accessory factor UbiK family protein [Neptuniibacter sp.]MCP4595261.1 accessory factor UbiK family protein [Neptuniibacter sp.]
MINPQLIEGLSEQFSQLMSGESKLPGQDSLQEQVKAILQGTFDRLDLVSREEFDAQKAVLLRTREKVEALEQQLLELEKSLGEKD